MNPFDLRNESALITGGGTGLGFGIAKAFVDAGARVVLVGRRESELAKSTQSLGMRASYIVHDVTKLNDAKSLIARAGEETPLTILVNNAGIHLKKPTVDTSPEEFAAVMQTHVLAAHALTAAILPSLIARRHGSILFTASMTALFGVPLVVAYSAAKSAYLGMVRSIATEVGEFNVRVNAIAPGWIESDMLDKALSSDLKRKEKILSRTPMQRFGKPDDIGNAAVYLCSNAAKFVTGVVLPVDGGASIGF